ncbi:hypothetical protein KR52_02280 [Synechococcus sp. KORDI-52]|uniref:DUF6554 family protein n=1 Tax=Synechococcus sp. KORDI-52 TaxID=585425 RepID=UPI0004E06554|nr:DUF6554 family protein [Synechococcus sp. KORDI-52]AII47987.1 hypothetical protein KR52_02280 [Synechococcus sp. KORDI-52]
MGPIRSSLVLSAAALIGALGSVSPTVNAAEATEEKGAKIYCFMRSSGNDHTVSWNAAYAVIKRQGSGMFKTSPEHASVMITEAVVKDPGNFPDCGQFLGDLFGGNTQPANAATLGQSSSIPSSTDDTTRYSY